MHENHSWHPPRLWPENRGGVNFGVSAVPTKNARHIIIVVIVCKATCICMSFYWEGWLPSPPPCFWYFHFTFSQIGIVYAVFAIIVNIGRSSILSRTFLFIILVSTCKYRNWPSWGANGPREAALSAPRPPYLTPGYWLRHGPGRYGCRWRQVGKAGPGWRGRALTV